MSGGDEERDSIGAAGHFGFAKGPVHGFAGAPGDAEFVCDGSPEVWFQSVGFVSIYGLSLGAKDGNVDVPVVDSCEFVSLLLIPLAAALEVVLVMQSAADAAAAG